MYIPKINKLTEQETIYRFMQENSFAIIVSELNGEIIATHMPVELEENDKGEKVLRSHMAKQNPQWNNFEKFDQVLVIFSGPHTYISSSWYDHVNVPTWNYIAVHVYGKPRILDEEETIGVLTRLVNRYENASEKPFKMENLSEDYLQSHLKALVAFEISIDRIDAKQKLSQNRNEHNYDLVINELNKREDAQSDAVKKEMERIKKDLFKK
ncbi:MAG: FMN-binding negative transcriptional regulator [Bacteroidetes bacterium]|jgi:transcriptional regulator|nr:FMN-binding negative transcriptional regulator [Bacteroidota bacterium]MBP9796781.1 FMN-binding negative transcriptional regulator [Chitinophagales bacterium]